MRPNWNEQIEEQGQRTIHVFFSMLPRNKKIMMIMHVDLKNWYL